MDIAIARHVANGHADNFKTNTSTELNRCALLLDEAHGFGVLGPQGRGALAAAGLTGVNASPRVLYMATLGKALGVAGAFVAGPDRLVEWLLQKTRSYTYATAAPALLAEAVRAGLRCVLGAEGERRAGDDRHPARAAPCRRGRRQD